MALLIDERDSGLFVKDQIGMALLIDERDTGLFVKNQIGVDVGGEGGRGRWRKRKTREFVEDRLGTCKFKESEP